MNCDVCPFLNNFDRTIVQTKHWKVDIDENQEYLGKIEKNQIKRIKNKEVIFGKMLCYLKKTLSGPFGIDF